MTQLPSGTVTFLFTDIEGSTRLLRQLGRDRYGEVLAAHQKILQDAIDRLHGHVVDSQGDALFAVFRTATDAVAAVIAAQRALAADSSLPKVRMGIHTGEATVVDGRYLGVAVHRAQRICAAAHGGQVLLSNATREVVEDDLPAEAHLNDLGEQRLKDLDRPARLFQLEIEGLPSSFPRLHTDAQSAKSGSLRRRQRLGARSLVAAIGAIALGAGVTIAYIVGGGPGANANAPTNAVGVIDVPTNKLVAVVRVGKAPGAITVGEGAVWAANTLDGTLSVIDPTTRALIDTVSAGGTPAEVVTGFRSVWVASPDGQIVRRINPDNHQITDTINLVSRPGVGDPGLAAGAGGIWSAAIVQNSLDRPLKLVRVDPATGVVSPRFSIYPGTPIHPHPVFAVGDGAVWILLPGVPELMRFDPRRNVVDASTVLAGAASSLAVGRGSVWVALLNGKLYRLDPSSLVTTQTIDVGENPLAVAVGDGAVWVANGGDGTVSRVDPVGSQRVATIKVGGSPAGIAVGAGAVWVTID